MKFNLPEVIIDQILEMYWYDKFRNSVLLEIKKLNFYIKEINNFMNNNFFNSNSENDFLIIKNLIDYNNKIYNIFNYLPYKKIIFYNNYTFKYCYLDNYYDRYKNISKNLQLIANYSIIYGH
jgi:hypothetical protein